ncbi:hypothetical protein Daura_37480 [Dactylosporangium aurantiacum]|uniref:Uncharacterized protein n=1 Tax=Dactylosporangium aurantiacum TaxID=35754 RepID=A0A9Q9IE06_9ACTN|nr:hypothetical protein [Dactylosporangium aurantiacum]UWZ52312.1 hypothetical protein Daura_37480 [Dactylosporangium aurantiacum]
MTTPPSPAGPNPDLPSWSTPDAPASGVPAPGTPPPGAPAFGPPTSGMPAYGPPTSGMPAYGPPTSGMPAYGPPTSGMPAYGPPTSGMPAFGPPTSGMPAYGAPDGSGLPPGGAPGWSGPPTGPVVGGPGAGWPSGDRVPSTGSRNKLIIGVVAAVLLLVCGAGAVAAVVGGGGSDKKPTSAAGGASASPTPSKAPEPVTATAYQTLLTEVDGLMGPAWQKVAGAKNQAATTEAVQALVDAAKASGPRFASLTPPKEAAAGHEQLKRAFDAFRNDFIALTGTVKNGEICAGSAAVAQVTGLQSATYLREAVKAFGSAFTFGAWLPAPVAQQTRTLANGTMVKKGTLNGSGEFTINNSGSDTDVVVSLVPNGTKVAAWTVYVSAGKTYKVKRVRDGNYQVYMTTGVDWDAAAAGFTRSCEFEKFTDLLEFKTTSRQYTTWEITLKASVGGNADTDAVDPGDYPQ